MTKSSTNISRSKTNLHWNDCFIHNFGTMEITLIIWNTRELVRMRKKYNCAESICWYLKVFGCYTHHESLISWRNSFLSMKNINNWALSIKWWYTSKVPMISWKDVQENKARYTAISRVRLGRGSNAKQGQQTKVACTWLI